MPNYKTREPSVCAGCQCFAIDGEHQDFWLERYATNRVAFIQARRLGALREGEVPLARARQARAILGVLGVEVPPVEELDEESSET